MAFQPGNQFGRAKHPNKGGYKTNLTSAGYEARLQRELKARAVPLGAEMAAQFVEKYLHDVLRVYVGLGSGEVPSKSGKGKKKKIAIDPATVRHLVERFIPPAPKKIDLGLATTAEDFYQEILAEAEARKDETEAVLIEDKSTEGKDGES